MFALRFAAGSTDLTGTSKIIHIVSHTFKYSEDLKTALEVR